MNPINAPFESYADFERACRAAPELGSVLDCAGRIVHEEATARLDYNARFKNERRTRAAHDRCAEAARAALLELLNGFLTAEHVPEPDDVLHYRPIRIGAWALAEAVRRERRRRTGNLTL